MVMDNTENLILKESKWYYLFSLGWAIIAWVGTMSFGLSIGGLIILLYSGLAYIYIFLLMIKFQYKWIIPRVFHTILIVCIFLLAYSTTVIDGRITLLALLINIPSAFIGNQFLASQTYSMNLKFNENNRRLSVIYNKLFIKITERIDIPENAHLKVIATTKITIFASRKGLFHVLQINHTKIFIAPTSLNGFSLFNKLITLLPNENLQIGVFPPTNTRLFVPRTYGTLMIPSFLYPHSYYEINDLGTYVNSPKFEQLSPRPDTFARSKAIIILMSLWTGFIFTSTATMMSILGLAPEIPFSILKYFVGIEIFILAVSIIITRNALAVWFGKLDPIISEKSVILQYKYGKKVDIEIHRSLNPVLIIENSILFLIILNDRLDFYYRHRIGRVTDDLPLKMLKTLN